MDAWEFVWFLVLEFEAWRLVLTLEDGVHTDQPYTGIIWLYLQLYES